MTKYYLGIDPGNKGAIAVIDQDKNIINIYDMPTIKDKKKTHIDFHILRDIILQHKENAFCMLEHAQSMPGNAAQPMFNYGTGFGALIQCLVDHEIEFQKVRPAKWKVKFALTNDKALSIIRSKELFRDAGKYIKFKKDDGRAEALLLAEYARRESGNLELREAV